MTKKPALPIYLDEEERSKVEKYSKLWGASLSGTIKRIIREYQVDSVAEAATREPDSSSPS